MKSIRTTSLSLNSNFTLTAVAFAVALSGLLPWTIQAQTCAAPPSGLVSWWKAEGNTLDTIGSNTGTNAGNTTYGTGRVGNAFVFDGNHDAVQVGNPTNLQL